MRNSLKPSTAMHCESLNPGNTKGLNTNMSICTSAGNRRELGSRISVCLLTYNHAHLIETTLNSILEQSIDGYEIIVSDDCSTDDTWNRIQAMAAQHPNIKAVRTPRNLGMPGNANYAVAISDRPYIALLHHDDIYRKDMLEKWAEVMERYSSVSFVFNPYGVYESDFVYRDPMPGACIDGHWLLNKYLLRRWGCVVRGTAMIRRSAWKQVGGMREQFGLLSDVDLWMRFAMRSKVGYVPEPVIAVRQSRPEEYPAEYKEASFSWRRQRFLYEIHAANQLAYHSLKTPIGWLKWWSFKIRLNLETTKWLIYAVVRKKTAMLATSNNCVTKYDMIPVRILRWILRKTFVVNQKTKAIN